MIQSLQDLDLFETREVLGATLLYGFKGPINTQTAVTDSVNRPKGPLADLSSDDVVVVEIPHPSHHKVLTADAQLALQF